MTNTTNGDLDARGKTLLLRIVIFTLFLGALGADTAPRHVFPLFFLKLAAGRGRTSRIGTASAYDEMTRGAGRVHLCAIGFSAVNNDKNKYTVKMHGRHAIIELRGRMNFDAAPASRRQILELVEDSDHLIVDLSRVTHIDCSVVANIVEAIWLAKQKNVTFDLIGVTEPVMRVLHLFRLVPVFFRTALLE